VKIEALQRDVNFTKDLSVLFELIRIIKKEKPDVLHLNSSKMGIVGTMAGRICRVPKIIFTAHDWAFNNKHGFFSKRVITFLQWMTVILSHITITVSQKTADQISSFPFINKNKIKVIYNGVSCISFIGRDDARRSLLPSRQEIKNELWIGTMSELHFRKGIDFVINSFAELAKKYPNIIFVVMGSGEEQMSLATQIKKLGLFEKIFLVGQTAEAKKYLKAFDIFTLTSRTEALPYALLEAGLAQLPVIATSVGGVPEVINSSETGILVSISKNTLNEVTTALERLIKNKEEQILLGQNLEHRIKTRFSKGQMLEETFALYR
jgi:glycosyltransferase involved in cell wall biosynthesis